MGLVNWCIYINKVGAGRLQLVSLHLTDAIWDGVSVGHEMIIAGSEWLIVEMS